MMTDHPAGAGKSSYDLIDQSAFWKAISLQPGMTVLDLACGSGRYLTGIADKIGKNGKIIAIDLWPGAIEQIESFAHTLSTPIQTHLVDASTALPLDGQSVDLCLMATVLHDLVQDNVAQAALKQVARILKPSGILAVVEFKKQDGPPGPPRDIRLRLEDVSMLLLPVGLIRFSPVVELGPDLWFAQFKRMGSASQ